MKGIHALNAVIPEQHNEHSYTKGQPNNNIHYLNGPKKNYFMAYKP